MILKPSILNSSVLFFIGLFLVGLARPAEAARLYFNPANGSYRPGETMTLELRLDNEGECVNAAEVNIGYPTSLVEAIDVSRGDSIFTIWVMPPTVRSEYGLVTFIGGIPGGYCGRVPGDPALTNVLAKVILRFKNESSTIGSKVPLNILNTSKVVLNDGKGTETKLTRRSAEFTVSLDGESHPNEWTEELLSDKIPPEKFTLEIHQDKSVFDGKKFLVWSTVDKQTGLDHYEILETKAKPSEDLSKLSWKKADSPYVLSDQTLKSRILVRAYDKAQNYETSEYLSKESNGTARSWFFWALASLGLLFLAIFRFIRFIPW